MTAAVPHAPDPYKSLDILDPRAAGRRTQPVIHGVQLWYDYS